MFRSISFDAAGRQWLRQVEHQTLRQDPICAQALRFLQDRLATSPATFNVSFHFTGLPHATIEWQSVFASAGVAYIRAGQETLATCLFLSGEHVGSEAAIIEVLESMLVTANPAALKSAFRWIHRHGTRPLAVTFRTGPELTDPQATTVTLASDCLAASFFARHPGTHPPKTALAAS